MLEQIGASAIYGAIGGGLGALLGYILALPFKNTKFSQMATLILVVAGAVSGPKFAEPLLTPHIGQYLPSSNAGSDQQLEKIMAELEQVPMFKAIFEKDPSFRDDLKNKFAHIMETAESKEEAQRQAFALGYNAASSKLSYYVVRATDKDIISFVDVVTRTLESLTERDPEFCYNYLYNSKSMSNYTIEQLRTNIGPELFDQQQEISAAVIRNASEDIPGYDVVTAQAGVDQAAGELQSVLGPGKIGLVTGALIPEDEADAGLACKATAAMYRGMMNLDNTAATARHLFVSAST